MTSVEAAPVILPRHTYSRGAAIFCTAAESFGIELPSEQENEWRGLIKAAFTLDTVLDSALPEAEREAAFNAGIGDLIITLGQQWSDYKTARITSAAMNVKEIADAKRHTASARALGGLAVFEGLETARFLQLEETGDSAVSAFNSWLRVLLPFGVAIDTAVDLPQDYRNGLTAVLPYASNRLTVASRSLPFIRQLVGRTPRNLFTPLACAARAITADTAKR